MVTTDQKTFPVCRNATTMVLFLSLGLTTSHIANQSATYSQALNPSRRRLYMILTELELGVQVSVVMCLVNPSSSPHRWIFTSCSLFIPGCSCMVKEKSGTFLSVFTQSILGF